MLMPPLHRRDKHTHAAPLDTLFVVVLALFPKERISGTRQHDDVRARAVTMRLLVLSDRKFRQMRAHRVIDKFEECSPIIATALFVVLGLKTPQIRDEIRFPDASSLDFW